MNGLPSEVLQTLSQLNPEIAPWWVIVVARSVLLSITVLLITRAYKLCDWVSYYLCLFLITGWMVNIPHRMNLMQPMLFSELLLTSGAAISLFVTHRILREQEEEGKDTCG